eukprot:TRINITY_DN67204_c6_g2_i1.p1 TRINITY_DN67204_c6_g2~~TRINITY_DN67204_c6_g2_i1.p1  ORF type:complete len:468 (+),score=-7.22 TRINITY_DN67204_c6_g2_i1:61-1464(+)
MLTRVVLVFVFVLCFAVTCMSGVALIHPKWIVYTVDERTVRSVGVWKVCETAHIPASRVFTSFFSLPAGTPIPGELYEVYNSTLNAFPLDVPLTTCWHWENVREWAAIPSCARTMFLLVKTVRYFAVLGLFTSGLTTLLCIPVISSNKLPTRVFLWSLFGSNLVGLVAHCVAFSVFVHASTANHCNLRTPILQLKCQNDLPCHYGICFWLSLGVWLLQLISLMLLIVPATCKHKHCTEKRAQPLSHSTSGASTQQPTGETADASSSSSRTASLQQRQRQHQEILWRRALASYADPNTHVHTNEPSTITDQQLIQEQIPQQRQIGSVRMSNTQPGLALPPVSAPLPHGASVMQNQIHPPLLCNPANSSTNNVHTNGTHNIEVNSGNPLSQATDSNGRMVNGQFATEMQHHEGVGHAIERGEVFRCQLGGAGDDDGGVHNGSPVHDYPSNPIPSPAATSERLGTTTEFY